MVATRQLAVKEGDVLLLVGTMKGAFLFRSGTARARWEMGGPYFPGQAVYALAYDARDGRRRLWAGNTSEHWGPTLSSSDDFGRTWTTPDHAPVRFPEDTGAAVRRIWQIRPGRADEPGTIYCGVEPAALFESRDGGVTWSLVRGLYDHPHRPRWSPGGGGLALHTIVPDAARRERLFVAISAGGVYRTDDGGATWQARNVGVRVEFMPDKHPEFGQCVHKIAQHPARPERLFLQNHWGLYRSDDGGDSWKDIARGVPSDFGFPMIVHPHDPETAYIVPLESDQFRCTPDGKLRVYRTRDAGGSWEALTRGLPQSSALETVLRDALAADRLNPAGIYFGTRSGQLWGSPNGGASWMLAAGGLPPIVCVKAAVVGEPRRARSGGATAATRGRSARARRPAAKPVRGTRARARRK
jgi:photosystem II stability/assembly factor-like uncharacterized protein